MIIHLEDDESMIIIRGNGKYQTIVPKQGPNERLCETSQLAFMLIHALNDDECMRIIRHRWVERLNETRSPN